MAEKLPQHKSSESLAGFEQTEISKPVVERSDAEKIAEAKREKHNAEKSAERARSKVEAESRKTNEVMAALNEADDHKKEETPTFVTKALKSKAYNDIMRSTRRQLKPLERTFSKVIHNPTVDTVSEVAAKTVARPYGIMGGALISLLISSFVVVIARDSGFEIPLSIFMVLFVIGYVIGLVFEAILRTVQRAAK